MSRTDDVINVDFTYGSIEVLSSHPDVAEAAVIGVADSLKGQVPIGLVVLKKNSNRDHNVIVSELVDLVRKKVGPVAFFKKACVVKRLPKTRSGKVLRAVMRKMADGEDYKVPATIDDPAVLDEIKTNLEQLGFKVKDR
eukprot:GEZU01027084.1.p1 GENE.GEZU01027084.1~~GEZU01027084.1.p1  ORF type:complete len:139 (-),score=31.59 GEZU01027084.1:112-528(-)